MSKDPASSGVPAKAAGAKEMGPEEFIKNAQRIAKAEAEEGEAQLRAQAKYDEMWSDPKRNQRSARNAEEA